MPSSGGTTRSIIAAAYALLPPLTATKAGKQKPWPTGLRSYVPPSVVTHSVGPGLSSAPRPKRVPETIDRVFDEVASESRALLVVVNLPRACGGHVS